MMPRYIDANAAYKTLVKKLMPTTIFDRAELKAALDEVSIADVRENKHGEWMLISPAGIYECSVCGQNVMTGDICAYKYCHGCGAAMRGDENAEIH